MSVPFLGTASSDFDGVVTTDFKFIAYWGGFITSAGVWSRDDVSAQVLSLVQAGTYTITANDDTLSGGVSPVPIDEPWPKFLAMAFVPLDGDWNFARALIVADGTTIDLEDNIFPNREYGFPLS